MSISFVGVQKVEDASSSATTDCPWPSGISAGQLALAFATANNANANATVLSSPWATRINQGASGSTLNPNIYVGWKILDGSESGNLTIPHRPNVSLEAIMVFDGVDTTTPFDVSDIAIDPGSGSSMNFGSQTLTKAGCALVYCASWSGATGNGSPATRSSDTFTEAFDRGTGGRNGCGGYLLGLAAGATGGVTLTHSGSGNQLGLLMALRPATTIRRVAKRWNGTDWVEVSNAFNNGSWV